MSLTRSIDYYEEHRQRMIEHERRMYEQARFGITASPTYYGNVDRGVKEVEKPKINKVLLLL